MSQRVKIILSYDGTDFGGWQKQKDEKPTIQGCLEEALFQLFEHPVQVVGAGRTDAGVHARAQVAHFDVEKDLSNYELVRGINTLCPSGITVREAHLAPPEFHSLSSAESKTYKYRILNSPTPCALKERFCVWNRHPLDLHKLNAYSELLVGNQDFKSFQSTGTPVRTTQRQIFEAGWSPLGEDVLEFTIRGSGFLKQMVRNIVGTLLDLHKDNASPEEMSRIIRAQNRCEAGRTAPPQGLYLWGVHYPETLDNKCRKI